MLRRRIPNPQRLTGFQTPTLISHSIITESGIYAIVNPPDAFHQEKIPTFPDRLLLRGLLVTVKIPQSPRQDIEKGLFTFHFATFRVDDFSLPKVDRSRIGPASYSHSTRIAPNADELNHIMQACVGYCSSETCPRRVFSSFHLPPGKKLDASTSLLAEAQKGSRQRIEY
jgi:hypothetical protein